MIINKYHKNLKRNFCVTSTTNKCEDIETIKKNYCQIRIPVSYLSNESLITFYDTNFIKSVKCAQKIQIRHHEQNHFYYWVNKFDYSIK